MPDALTYAEAAALAQRLDRARARGAKLLLDGQDAIAAFEVRPEVDYINAVTAGGWANFYYPGHHLFAAMTPAEFEAHWQSRITVTYPGPWPTGEPVTWKDVRAAMETAEDAFSFADWHSDNAALARTATKEFTESAARLAQVCRELATETGENAG